MINDVTMPLTKEELAAYNATINPAGENTKELVTAINNLSGKLDEMMKNYHTAQLEVGGMIVSAINNVVTAQNDSAAMTRKQLWAMVSNIKEAKPHAPESAERQDPIFYTTMSLKDQERWIKKQEGLIADKCLDGGSNEGVIFRAIYNGMKNDGYDVTNLLKDYSRKYPKATALEMVAASDVLRLSWAKSANNYYYKKVLRAAKSAPAENVKTSQVSKKEIEPAPVTVNKKKYSGYFQKAQKVPAEIRGIISSLATNGNPTGHVYKKAEKLLCEKRGIQADAMTKKVCEKFNIKKCNFWFAVSQYPELVETLENIVANARG